MLPKNAGMQVRAPLRTDDNAPVRPLHLVLLLVAICLSVALRAPGLSGFSITHWDEGLAWRGARYFLSRGHDGHYSPTHGPPLVSLAMAAWSWLFGPRASAAVWLNMLLATGAVPLIYWVARQVATPRAGLLAAFLLAGSGLHAMFARSLLTESAYIFFLLLSLGLSLRALSSLRPGWFLAAGLAVACTQATKYNGCLAAVPLATLLIARFVRTPESGGVGTLATRLALLGLPAVACIAANLGAIAMMGDLDAFLEHYGGYVGQTTDLSTLGSTLAWVMPWAALGVSALGVALTLGRGERPTLIHLTLLLYAVFLLRYSFYLRLLAPVATLLLLCAALGLDALALRLPRSARAAVIGLVLIAVGAQSVARAGRYYMPAFDGYRSASAWLNSQTDRPTTLIAGQEFVWDYLEFKAPVVALPSRSASAILDASTDIQLVIDVGAFSRLRPWSLESIYPLLRERHHVRSFDATLNLDALQNNLTLDELQRLDSDPELRERVLQIHVFRLSSGQLKQLLRTTD
ncbi:MAG: 4-amino-4-deoxy-L-arabinose transferase-like glycosyltransferase [Chlamydiales bacterium]